MAEKYAVANGNWSNPGTWNDGTLPGNEDDVYANGKTVTIDIDLVGSYSVLSIRTTAGSTAAAGGYFQVTESRTIEFVAGGSGIVAGTTTCLVLDHAYPAEVIIRWATGGSGVIVRGGSSTFAFGIGNDSSGSVTVIGDVTGGSGVDACGIDNYSSGSVTVIGDVTGGNGTSTYGIWNESTGSVTVTGDVTGGSGFDADGIANDFLGSVTVTGDVTGGGNTASNGIYNYTGSVTVTGDVTGGSYGNAYGIYNSSTGSVTVIGDVTGGSGVNACGIYNWSTGSVTVTGDVTGGSGEYAYGIGNSSSGIVTINGDCYAGKSPALYNVANGVIDVYGSLNPSPTYNTNVAINNNATSGKIIFTALKADTTNHRWPGVLGRCFVRDINSYLQIYDKDEQQVTYIDISGVNPPAESDVRYGVTYTTAGGVRTGTCHVPAPDSVAYGVPVDNTVGTAVLRMSDVANAVWNELRSAHTIPGTFGAVSEWAGGGSGGSDWTDDEKKQIRYRLGVDGTTQTPSTNTPHLGSTYSTLDDLASHVSTRLAASDYVAPDNSSIASIKSKTDAYLDATVSSRLAASDYVAPDNTSISAIKSRTDAYLDAAVSSRLSSSAYVAPDNASITAIKAKTDNLTFNEDNYVYAVGVGESGGTDWTDDEKKQIRYRLGIDGTTESPSTNTPHLGSSYADLDQLASHGDSAWATVSPAAIWAHDTRTITGGTVTTVNDKSGYRLSAQGVDDIWDEPRSGHTITGSFGYYLDAAISSRSTFNPNTDQVTVAINNDKTGYSLAPDQSSVIIGQVNNLGGTGLAAVAGAVWNASRDDHTETGTFGAVSEWAGGGSEGSDWTDAEKQQIRYRLGIDGTTASPQSNTPHLGSTYSTLDDLAAHVSTRLAASDYTPPDNASIAAIKTKTDQLSFDTEKVLAKVSDPVTISSTDVSAIVDGVWNEPAAQHTQTGSTGALLGAAGSGSVDYNTMAQAVWQYATRELTGFSFQVTVGTNLDKTNYALTSAYDRAKDALKYTEYTAPDNTGIAAIKAQTDKLSFTGTDVKATLDGETVTVANNLDKSGYALTSAYDRAKDALKYTEYTAPDNANIAAIKTKTDQLTFDTEKVLAKVNDPVSLSSTDVNAIVDGIWDEPISQHTTTGSAGAILELAGSNSVDYNTMAQAVWQYTTRELTGFNFQVTVGTNLDKSGYALTSAYDRAKDALKYTEYTAPDNTGIAAIKAQTDKLSFIDNDIKATLDGEAVTVAINQDKIGYSLVSDYDRAKDALKYTEYTPPDNTDIIAILNQVNRIQFTPENYIRSAVTNPEAIAQTIFTYDITKAENLAPAYSLTTLILGSLYMVTSNNTLTIYKSNGLPHLTRNLGIDPLDGHISAIRP